MANSGSFNTNGYDGRYLNFSWTLQSQSTENNSSVISWTLKGAGTGGSSWYKAGNFKVVINGSTVYASSTRINLYNGTVVASGTLTINHGSDGSKTFSASAEAGIYTVAVNCKGSGSWSLPTIYRYATITSAPNFNDVDNPTIKYSNPAGNNVTSLQACISLTGSRADIAYRDISKTGSSYTFNLTEAERNVLRSASPNSNTLNVRFYVQTVIGGQTYREYIEKKMTIVNAAPTISGVSYKDTNSTTLAITGNNQQIIQNQSTVSFTLGTLTSLKYATLKKVEITVNAVTVSTNLSGTSVTNRVIAFGGINSSSNIAATIKLTDSRGNTATSKVNITMLAWSLPTALISCARKNNYYSDTDITVNADYASLGGNNTITIEYQTKAEGSSSWSALSPLQDNVQATITLDNTKSWDIRVILTDRLGSTTYNLSIDKGIPIIYFDRLKRSVGINCFPNNDESLEVEGIDILRELFYFPGDTYSVSGRIIENGYISDSSKQISFSLAMPKNMKNVTPKVTTLKVNGRHVGGGYIFSSGYIAAGYDILADSNITVTVTKDENYITILLQSTTAWSVTNNTPVSIALENLKITFTQSQVTEIVTENGENIVTENGENIITEV